VFGGNSTEAPLSDVRAVEPPSVPDAERATSPVREFIDRSQQTLEDWQRRVDERLRHLIDSVSPFAALEREVHELRARIERLEQQPPPPETPLAKGQSSS
jgi:hypothetical protein